MARRYFGTDGIRGIVGGDLTTALVEKIGRAAVLWAKAPGRAGTGSDPGRVLIGRDTRGSGPELEAALGRGISSTGWTAVLAGVLPTPAVALLTEDLGAVISASHNPPEYNGVKLFDGEGCKLADEDEEAIETLLDAPAPVSDRAPGAVERLGDAPENYLRHILEGFGSNLAGLRIAVDCANGAFSELAPKAFEELGAEVHPIGNEPDGRNINVGCGATDLSALQETVTRLGLDLGVAFDGDGDRMLAVDERGEALDGDQILAILVLALGVDRVAVTVMTNLGFHRLMAEHGIRVVTTPVGDRYLLEALRRDHGLLGGEQSGHIVWLGNHVTGDGLAAALLLCRALGGRTLSEAAATMPRYPQAKRNVPVLHSTVPQSILDEADRITEELAGAGRVLVRPSGTEPLVRVLAEAETAEEAGKICASIAALVATELG
ncbi:MAG: phosphoglucosamine mutase [Actinomycetota bacterium]|nr:phosphoglucosamine mutase [Actinomycetota bacterium]